MAKAGAIVPQASGDRPLPPAHSPEILREAKLAVAYAVEGKKKRMKFGDLFEAQNGQVFIRDGSSAVVKNPPQKGCPILGGGGRRLPARDPGALSRRRGLHGDGRGDHSGGVGTGERGR